MSFLAFVHSLANELLAARNFRRAEACLSTANSISRFCNNDPMALKAVFSPTFICSYRDALVRAGCDVNTITFYIATLRSIAREAAGVGLIRLAPNLFSNVRTRVTPGVKRALPPGLLGRIFSADLSGKPRLVPCRDYVMLSVLLQGISFVDLAHLRKTDIHGDVISYSRSKTGSPIRIPVSPEIRELFAKYANQTADSPYLLPLVTLTGAEGYRQYNSAIHRQNRHLKELAAYLGIEENLTTYCFRHSWATIAHHNGIDIAVVSQGMGHQREKTTRIYLAPFDISRLAEANRVVLNVILKSIPAVKTKDACAKPKVVREASSERVPSECEPVKKNNNCKKGKKGKKGMKTKRRTQCHW